MKKGTVLILLLTMVLCRKSFAQIPLPKVVYVAKNTTTILVFPYNIKNADRGSTDIEMDTVSNAPYILKVKAVSATMSKTNLTVITTDDRIYSVDVAYDPCRPTEPYNFTGNPLTSPVNQTSENSGNKIEGRAKFITNIKAVKNRPRIRKFKMDLRLAGIYSKAGILYFQFTIANKSTLVYHSDFVRCYQRAYSRAKRTSQVEKEMFPRFSDQNLEIKPNGRSCFVLALDQFTIADGKKFSVDVYEKNGDRHLSISIKGKEILSALPM